MLRSLIRIFSQGFFHFQELIASLIFGFPMHHFLVIGMIGTDHLSISSKMTENLLKENGYDAYVIDENIISKKISKKLFFFLYPFFLNYFCSKIQHTANTCIIISINESDIWYGQKHYIPFDTLVVDTPIHSSLIYFSDISDYIVKIKELGKRLMFSLRKPNIIKSLAFSPHDEALAESLSDLYIDKKVTFDIRKKSDIFLKKLSFTSQGSKFNIECFNTLYTISFSSLGTGYVYGTLMAISVAWLQGISFDRMIDDIHNILPIPDKYEKDKEYSNSHIISHRIETVFEIQELLFDLNHIRQVYKWYIKCSPALFKECIKFLLIYSNQMVLTKISSDSRNSLLVFLRKRVDEKKEYPWIISDSLLAQQIIHEYPIQFNHSLFLIEE